MGFNCVKLPYSDQMVIENPVVDQGFLGANLDLLDTYDYTGALTDKLASPRALYVFSACVEAITQAGVAVIINNHVTSAHRRSRLNLCDAGWKNDRFWPICQIVQTTESWIGNWQTVMMPFIDNPLVIGADLRNEPSGLWGTMTWSTWAAAAERAGEALLKMQPNWLMFVEGISSANDCSAARLRPVKLSVPDRVIYSTHVYKWSGWSTLIPYGSRHYPSFELDMERNWGYLLRDNVAPVWLGGFGTKHQGDSSDLNYWNHLMRYMREYDVDWSYSTLNSNQPSTCGLLMDDWETPIHDFRMRDLRTLMSIQS